MTEPRNQCAGPFGAVYDFYIERDWLMLALGRIVWGIDMSCLYESFEPIANAAEGATIIDVPCGGGVAFRALRPDQNVRYIAADLSEKMLSRAQRRAHKRGLEQVELCRADMLSLPFESDSADLLVSYSGLHMLDEPKLAVSEMARCLKPGGQLVGTTFLREGSWRQRKLFEQGQRQGHALPPAREDLHRWFADSGIAAATIEPHAGFAVFRGHKQSASA